VSTTEGNEHEKTPADESVAPAADAVSTVDADQAALAQKVDALLGEKDDLEILARQEEAKLEARTGGRGKQALEDAANKRLAEIGTKKAKRPEAQAAPEVRRAAVSSALSTPDRVSDFLTRNRKAIGSVAGAAVVGLAILGGYAYAAEKKREHASSELAQAFAAIDARIVTPEQAKNKTKDDDVRDDGPTYGSAEERAEAALAKLDSIAKNFPRTGPAYIAAFTRATVLSEQGKFDDALAAFKQVKESPLGKADLEVSLRSSEGMGAVHEALALRNADRKKAELEAALVSYKELIDSDALGFAELGQYHTARVYEQQGEVEKAKELYHALVKKLTKPAEEHPLHTYLEAVVTVRLQAVEPGYEPPRMPSMGGESKLDEAQIKKMLEELKKNPGKGGPVGGEQH